MFLLKRPDLSKKGSFSWKIIHNSGIFFLVKDKEDGLFTNSIRV